MGAVAGYLIRGQHARRVHGVLEILVVAACFEQHHQRVRRNTAFVRLDLVGMIALRAGVRGQRKLAARAGGARKGRVNARIRRERFLH